MPSGSLPASLLHKSTSVTTSPITKPSTPCTAPCKTSTASSAKPKSAISASSLISSSITLPTSTNGFWIRAPQKLPSIAIGISGATAKTAAPPTTGNLNSASLPGPSTKKLASTITIIFIPRRPHLGRRTPAVKNAMLDVTRFWYKRGVAGFRLDAVDTLFEDPNLTDNPPSPGKDKFGRPNFARIYNTKLPEVHDVLQDLRKIADQYDAVLIGETWTKDIDELKNYYGENSNELQMPMDLMFGTVNKLSAPEFRRQIAAVDSAGGWPVFVISNHDMVRSYNRYGDGLHNDEIAKLMASLYLTLRGSPIMYYGEELGMQNNDPKRKEDVKDPQGITGWPGEIGRDGERTPMQWSDAKNAGFSTAKPWLPVPPAYKTHNVATESKDPNSILSVYRQLLAMRHNEPALVNGTYTALNEDDPNVLSYLRKDKNEAILVMLNMSNSPQKIKLNLAPQGFASSKLTVLLSTFQPPSAAPADA